MALLAALLAYLLGWAPVPWAQEGSDIPAPGEVTVPLAAQARGARPDDPPILGPDSPNRPLIVLDPGHGGRDSGAVSPHDGAAEKHVVLELARAIRDELVRSGRMRVALTRDDDRLLPLRERYEIARRLGADLFISVHADAAPNGDTVVKTILIDLAQRESMGQSAQFAQLLHREASTLFPFRPEPHRFASLMVLKAPDLPSILLEAGYMTNMEDSAYIQSPEGRARIATGLRRALDAHFARRNIQMASR
jgi:N-acetylmuramoyl-L-alanine amidase